MISKGISILTFPGFMAAAGFGLLCNGVFVSTDLLTPHETFNYIHTWGAIFGYVLVPLLFVFILLWQKKIQSITMPLISERKWGFLGALAGAFQVFVMTWFDAPERAGRLLRMLSKQVNNDTLNLLKSHNLINLDPRLAILVDQIQAYTLVVLLCLFLMYCFVLGGKKLSIHTCAATAVLTQLYLCFFHLYDQIPVYQHCMKSFGLPWCGWGANWFVPLTLGFVFFGGALLGLIYWARRHERAHTHTELLGGLFIGFSVPILGHFI